MKKLFLFLAIFFAVSEALACACGCGVMNVGTSSLIPNCEGGTAFLQFDDNNQTRNWHKNKASTDANDDKNIHSKTATLGTQYMFNRSWGAAVRVPLMMRYVKTSSEHDGDSYAKHSNIGDIRLNGIYSGFSEDMSTGITFGLKLPTGQSNSNCFSRDTQIGTGSTDSILGAYHVGNFGKSSFGYFMQGSWERPFIIHQGYNPGYEISAATGVYYNAGELGVLKKISPILQITGAKRGQNTGFADLESNANSGYTQIFLAPGIEVAFKEFKIYADVEFPIYRSVNGLQLVPQNIFKVILGYNF